MTDSVMTIGRFKDLLNTYGSDLSRWPIADVSTAQLLIKTNETARNALKEADALDTLFDAGSNEKAPKGLLDKIMHSIDSDKH